jgi:hypothetical protein
MLSYEIRLVNRSLSKWLLGCAISPYILGLFVFLSASSLFNSFQTAFCCAFVVLLAVSCSTTVPICRPVSRYPICAASKKCFTQIKIIYLTHLCCDPQPNAVSRSKFLLRRTYFHSSMTLRPRRLPKIFHTEIPHI